MGCWKCYNHDAKQDLFTTFEIIQLHIGIHCRMNLFVSLLYLLLSFPETEIKVKILDFATTIVMIHTQTNKQTVTETLSSSLL